MRAPTARARSARPALLAGLLAIALAVVAATAGTPSPASAAAPARVLTGTVSDATTGDPLDGVTVTLWSPDTTTAPSPSTDSTDADGTYSIPLDDASGTGFVVETYLNDGVHVLSQKSAPFTIAASATAVTQSIALATGARLTGHVSSDAAPDGLEGAAVNTFDADGTASGFSEGSDDSGDFVVTGLAAGTYTVQLGATGLADRYAGTGATPQMFSVTAGQATDVGDVHLVAGATVSGTVTDQASGRDLAGVVVELTPTGSAGGYAAAITDASGDYAIDDVSPGAYTLSFGSVDSTDTHVRLYSTGPSTGSVFPSKAETIQVAGTATTVRSIALPVGGALAGTAAGAGAASSERVRATAYAYDATSKTWFAVRNGYATADRDGAYSIAGLAQGRYTVGFAAMSPTAGLVPEYYDDVSAIADATIVDVTGTATTSGVDAILTPTGPLARFTDRPQPLISGTTKVQQYLTAVVGDWAPVTPSFGFQWNRDGVPIPGATASTFRLLGVDAGTAISVTVTARAAGYEDVVQTSDPTTAITPGAITLSTPTVTGTRAVGSTQTASVSSSPASAARGYQWLRSGVAIAGATKSTYKLVAADGGRAISVRITGTLAGYTTAVKTSVAFAPPRAFTATPTPTISGTAKVGSRVSAKAGTWSPAPVTLSYQWKRNGVTIAGAVKSYHTVTSADRGKKITVTVTGRKSGYRSIAVTSAGVVAK